MSCHGNNATPPSPGIAPGSEGIDPARVAAEVGEICARQGALDPRLAELVPGFDAPFVQAGLAGYSDAAMRIIARRHGCPLCVTEALLDRTLLAGGRGFVKADLGELHDNVPGGEEDHPLVGQIMGSEPAEMAAAALKMIEQGARANRAYRRLAYDGALAPGQEHLRLPGGEQVGREREAQRAQREARDEIETYRSRLAHDGGRVSACANGHAGGAPAPSGAHDSLFGPGCASFAAIDVNLACPVKKISSKSRGGHWLAEPEGAIRILEAVRESVPREIPTSVKMRRSFDDTPEMAGSFERILCAAFDMGYAWATVHGRTVEQKYVGPSRWDLLREIVARHPGRAIFGSGDVWGVRDIFRMIAYTGVRAVSVARGCIGNPWIFRQARQMMAGRPPQPPTIDEQRAVLLEHFDIALAVNRGTRRPEMHTARAMRKFGIRFSEHHPRGEEVRRAMIGVESLEDWRRVVGEWYAGDLAAVRGTGA
ncbi:MAG: tRNA-dihydrouridine synthase family protein [Phycisphaeraceae bacterium]|nr:tRNA-dihydrouridine synthase family protein [Phycisphaeraceae bacterium]